MIVDTDRVIDRNVQATEIWKQNSGTIAQPSISFLIQFKIFKIFTFIFNPLPVELQTSN